METIPNFLLITLDSCRWDTYQLANTPTLDKFFMFEKAYSQATYTLPSHISMFQGMFPSSNKNIQYFNRFSKPILRINERNKKVEALINFPKGTESIFHGFHNLGKRTIGIGALPWFNHKWLNSCFDEFILTGIDLERQCSIVKEFIVNSADTGFAILLNIGETHEPYEIGGLIEPSLLSRARVRSFEKGAYDGALHQKQIDTLEKIDIMLEGFLDFISNDVDDTLIICCADHGECFGEDGLWGHGFYHPKVMEVPMGISNSHL